MLFWVVIILAIAIIAALFSLRLTSPKEDQAPEPYGLDAMTGLDRLPYLKTAVFAGGASSYDRSDGNADGFGASNFLYQDEHGDKVMLDIRGPGTVYRMWFTGFDIAEAYVKVYFDGETEPRIHRPLRELFDGSVAPFLSPLAADDRISSGGFVSYVPLTFSKSVKIATNGAGQHFFYNIGYHQYSPDMPVATWTGTEDSTAAREMWNKAGSDPKNDEGNIAVSDTIDLAGASSASLLEVDGPRSISSIKLNIPRVQPDSDTSKILNTTRLKIYYDGESDPSVDAPLGSFFAMGEFGAYPTRTVPVGMDEENTMYVYFPMPFEKKVKIELVNTGTDAVEDIFYEVKHKPFTDSFANVGYFKTRFSELKAEAGDGKDLLVLEEEGSGHFVGMVQSLMAEMYQGPVDRWHLEGDERVYVDDSESPVIHGTGTEDFYNGGWYFSQGLFTTPMAGYTAFDKENNIDSTAMYRLFVHDVIPFRKNIRVSIQHGALNDVSEDVSMLAYYYHKPAIKSVLTDTLDVGNESSEKSHTYTIDKEVWSDSRIYQYEGNFNGELIEDNGRAHAGYSEFITAVEPDNEGVILRRRFDQMVENQTAKIYVDDTYAGMWYKAGSNGTNSWRDEDFMIPASFTEGKDSIRIKVEFVPSTTSEWNEFRYDAYSLLP